MKFVVIGYGFVGKAIANVLRDKHDVDIHDPAYTTVDLAQPYDGYIICVPTPARDDGRVDDSLVEDYVTQIYNTNANPHILIKSTTGLDLLQTYIGTNITFSPEFLRGSVGVDPNQEFRESKFQIYGGRDGRYWHNIFWDLMNYDQVRYLGIMEAGFLKYTENSFLATKVTFFNEIYNLFNTLELDNFDSMIEALALDERIGYSHTQVPGPDSKKGWGGHCLPKDTAEFSGLAQSYNSPLELLDTARRVNLYHRS